MFFKKKEKDKEEKKRSIVKIKLKNGEIKVFTQNRNKEEEDDWPEQYEDLIDWFYYKTKQETFSFRYSKGVIIFRKVDVEYLEVYID